MSYFPQGYFVTAFSSNHALLYANLIFLTHLHNKSDFGASFFSPMANTVHLLFHQVPLLSFQAMVAGIQQAHAEQLANMRIQDLKVSLKPLHSVNNPILRKRKLLG